MKKTRLDKAMINKGLASTRSQAENIIKLGQVKVDGRLVDKPGLLVDESVKISLIGGEQFVSRAGLKLASANNLFRVEFKDKVVLDVGSSTGGFTDYVLRRGAKKVIAVDVGTNQLHHSLRANDKVLLYEKTDIRNFEPVEKPDIITLDVSFISLKEILPAIVGLSTTATQIVALVKPQFEAGKHQINKGIIKNDTIRRAILAELENYFKKNFVIVAKVDSEITGAKGNRERFYLLKKIK